MKAVEFLEAGVAHMSQRASMYDSEQGERSIDRTVAMFRELTGHDLTPEEGWMFMVCLKLVRSQQGAFRSDSYEDGAAYFALAGESAFTARATSDE